MNTILKFIAAFLVFFIITDIGCFGQERPLPENPLMVREQRINALLSQMTLEEKVDLLSGIGYETRGNERLGIPALKMTDGPAGVRFGQSTAYPAPIALAATWDTSLVYLVGKAIAKEASVKGRNVLLAPFVNIMRHPLGGRNFESFGEDPCLAGQMAAAFINGVQSEPVIACVKHFVCNNQEWEKQHLNVLPDERALREIYLPAFRAAVQEARAGAVMTASNMLRNVHCAENAMLINQILKKEWAYEGFVIADLFASHNTLMAAWAGLDLEMSGGMYFGEPLADSVRSGAISETVIDEKVRRRLRASYDAGLLDQDNGMGKDSMDLSVMNQLALQAARESIVLLKNQGGLLPLDRGKIKSIAVIGPNAFEARTGGGGSSQVTPHYTVTPIEGLENITNGKIRISSTYGVAAKGDIIPLAGEYMRPHYPLNKHPGLKADYYNNPDLSGNPVLTRVDTMVNFIWGVDVPHPDLSTDAVNHNFSVRWKGKLIPPASGVYRLNVLCHGGCRLYIDNTLMIDDFEESNDTTRYAEHHLESGKEYDVLLEYNCRGPIALVKFGWTMPDEDLVSAAVYHAKNADVAIVFAGLSNLFESEGYDRKSLDMPDQDRLIKAVVQANPKTVVVMQTGAQVIMESWVREVPAILQAWYPGQEGGNAIAEVIFGKFNPTGRLPMTIAWTERDYPAFKDYKNENMLARYHEGILVGYRYFDTQQIKPLFPFGHGLSYATIGIGKLLLHQSSGTYNYYATVEMTNMGSVKGTEVLQLYIRALDSVFQRPEKELKRFKRITLEPGERILVRIPFTRSDFASYDEATSMWKVEPGQYEVLIGTSSGNIKLRKPIEIK